VGLPFRLQRENISMLSYEKTGSRYEIRGKRGMRKFFIKYTVPMIVDTAKLANPILWTAG